MNPIWADCPFRSRVSLAIDILKGPHLGLGTEVVTFIKPNSGRQVDVLFSTIGDRPGDLVLERIQAYCLDGIPFLSSHFPT